MRGSSYTLSVVHLACLQLALLDPQRRSHLPVVGATERVRTVDWTRSNEAARSPAMRDHQLPHKRRRQSMAPIIASAEISRSPEDVFAYVTDPSHLPEWQESVVSVKTDESAPDRAGSQAVITRRVGRREMKMTAEIADLDPPRSWRVRGLDGPVRGNVRGTIEPLDDGARSRVTIELDFEGHGIGKLLVPLVVRRQAQKELPKNALRLKERLESGAT
jgi:uncharacterized protein YndB with AHSA1/START domain